MKNSKLLISCLSFMIALFLTSCIDSDGNSKQTYYSYVTVKDGGKKLLADDGVILYPSLASISQLKDFATTERAYVGYTLQEIQDPSNPKGTYSVDLGGYAPIKVDNILSIQKGDAPADTLKTNNDPVKDFGFVSTKDYVTMQTTFYYVQGKVPSIKLWRDMTVNNADTLFLNLYFNDKKVSGESLGYQPGTVTYSYKTGDLKTQFPAKQSVIVAIKGLVENDYQSKAEIKKVFKVQLD